MTIRMLTNGEAVEEAVLNRPIQDALAASNYQTDGSDFGGFPRLQYPERPGAFQALLAALREGLESVGVQVIGDSTGNDTNEWVYLVAQWLAPQYPGYTVKHMLWNDTTQAFDAPTVVQQGTNAAGRTTRAIGISNITGSKCFYLPGGEIPWFTNDVDIRVRVAPQLWVVGGATDQTIFARWGASGSRGFRFQLERSSGKLNWSYTTDGSTIVLVQSTIAAPGTNGQALWVRLTHQMNNGAAGNTVTFYTSTDGVAWTQLGTPVVTAGTLAGIFNPGSAQQWELLGRGTNVELTAGEVLGLQVLDGIAGRNIGVNFVDAFKAWDNSLSTSYIAGSPELWFVNCSKPGADITYLSDSTRLPKMTPNYQQVVCFLSCSHNDGTRYGASYTALWDAWLSAVKTRVPLAHVIIIGQNPRTTPANEIAEHAARYRQLMAWAAKNSLAHVDVWRAFRESATPIAQLVDPSDGIHPLPLGSQLWATTVERAITRRI